MSTDPKTSADFALCETATDLPISKFERIGTERVATTRNTPVVLLGYGCRQASGFDATFGVLHRGDAMIERVGTGEDLYLVAKGKNAVCYGDSGGATYYYTGPDRRVIIGVNSRGNIVTHSYISSTATDVFAIWAMEWAENHNDARVCGLHPDAKRCRTN